MGLAFQIAAKWLYWGDGRGREPRCRADNSGQPGPTSAVSMPDSWRFVIMNARERYLELTRVSPEFRSILESPSQQIDNPRLLGRLPQAVRYLLDLLVPPRGSEPLGSD